MSEPVPPEGPSETTSGATPTEAPAPEAVVANAPLVVVPPEPASAPPPVEPPKAPPPPPPLWRFWPDTTVARVLLVLFGVATSWYCLYAVSLRYTGMWDPWAIDGDQPQAVFQYWRYNITGAFKPGDLLVDYAFVMHAPPVWWAFMATMSSFFSPILAAKILNVVACVAACAAIWWGVSRRSNAFIGFVAMALLVRSVDFTGIIAGGYARSFGPALTLLFLGTFMAGRHKLTLGVLVLQAALYPSVVIPCGLAYGAYTVLAGPMRERLFRMGTMFLAGLLIIGFGESQNLSAPKWWGSVVTLEEALKMPAWQAGGRISEAPPRPIPAEVGRNLTRAVRPGGHVLAPAASRIASGPSAYRPHVFLGVLIVACGAWWVFRRRRGRELVDPMPWQVPATFLAGFLGYLLARELAFRLYLPYRPLQHVWPYMFYAGLPLAVWTLVVNTMPYRRGLATLLAAFLTLAPMFVLFGDGLERGPATYASHRRFARTYNFVQKLPVDAVLAGEFGMVDKTPLFAWHKSYVNRVLAHPFRAGFYNETERRIVLMYRALYATDLKDVVTFADTEKVDYLIYRTSIFNALDGGLFNPPRRILAPVFNAGKKKGFALLKPPPSSVIYREGTTVVVEIAKLKEALAAPPPADLPPTDQPIDQPTGQPTGQPTDQPADAVAPAPTEDKDDHSDRPEGDF